MESIQNAISSILDTWNENNIEEFLDKTKNGKLDTAVMDAISMRQLTYDLDNYQEILRKLKE